MPDVDFRITGGEDFKRLAKALGGIDKELSKALRRSMKDAATPLAAAAKAEAGRWSKTVARSIVVQVQPGAKGGARVAIVAKQNKMPAGHGPFPALMEGRQGRGDTFRHPVFGNRDKWVAQKTHPYLAPSITPKLPAALALVANALERAAAAVLSAVGH